MSYELALNEELPCEQELSVSILIAIGKSLGVDVADRVASAARGSTFRQILIADQALLKYDG